MSSIVLSIGEKIPDAWRVHEVHLEQKEFDEMFGFPNADLEEFVGRLTGVNIMHKDGDLTSVRPLRNAMRGKPTVTLPCGITVSGRSLYQDTLSMLYPGDHPDRPRRGAMLREWWRRQEVGKSIVFVLAAEDEEGVLYEEEFLDAVGTKSSRVFVVSHEGAGAMRDLFAYVS